MNEGMVKINKDDLLIIGALSMLIKDAGLEEKIYLLISDEKANKYLELIDEYGKNTTEEEREVHLIDLFLNNFSKL